MGMEKLVLGEHGGSISEGPSEINPCDDKKYEIHSMPESIQQQIKENSPELRDYDLCFRQRVIE